MLYILLVNYLITLQAILAGLFGPSYQSIKVQQQEETKRLIYETDVQKEIEKYKIDKQLENTQIQIAAQKEKDRLMQETKLKSDKISSDATQNVSIINNVGSLASGGISLLTQYYLSNNENAIRDKQIQSNERMHNQNIEYQYNTNRDLLEVREVMPALSQLEVCAKSELITLQEEYQNKYKDYQYFLENNQQNTLINNSIYENQINQYQNELQVLKQQISDKTQELQVIYDKKILVMKNMSQRNKNYNATQLGGYNPISSR